MQHKDLSPANWKEPDPTSTQFGRMSPVAGPVAMTEQDWARSLLAVDLKDHVPEGIRDLFLVARGAALYGWLFYPLFRLGEEQVYRVIEAATKTCYQQVGGPKRRPTFKEAVDWLVEAKVIPLSDGQRWEAVRMLRNAASHLSQPTYMTPGAVLSTFQASAHDINRLFARAQQQQDVSRLTRRNN